MNDYEMLYMINQKDHDAVNIMLAHYERFLWSVVHHACFDPEKLRLEKEDLFQEATIGFLKAIERFDVEVGVKFSVYLYHCCLHQVRLFIRRNRGMAYQLLSNAISLNHPAPSIVTESRGNLEEVVHDNNPGMDPVKMAHYIETKGLMDDILEDLSPLEKKIFFLRNQGYTYNDIAKACSTTSKKVDNILQKIRRLAKQKIDL